MPRRDLLILGGITLAAAAVRFATLDVQSFDHDEAVTAREIIAPGLGDTLDNVIDSERSPPLYYLLTWVWSQLFGTGEAGLRSLSALIGTAVVPATFIAGRELVSARVGLFGAAFVALNPYLVWYSQESRSYGLLVLFTVLALAFFARSLRVPSRRSLSLWALFSALALCSHYFAGFLIVVEAAWLLALVRPVGRPAVATAAIAAVALALSPLALEQQGGDRRDAFADRSLVERTGEVALDYLAGDEPDPFTGDRTVDAMQGGAAVAGALLLVVAIALIARRGDGAERRGAVVVGGIAAGAIGLPLLLALGGADFFNPRNLIAALPPILLVLAIGLGGERAGRLGAIGAAATCALFAAVALAVNLSEQMQRANWRGAAEEIGPSPSSRVVVGPRNGDDPLAYYLDGEPFNGRAFVDGVRVREIAVLSTTFDVTSPRGFELVEQRPLAPLFFLWRYRARRPVPIRPGDVLGDRILRERSAAVVDGLG